MYLLNMIYFLFKGPLIVQLLDSSIFQDALKFKISANKIISVIVVLDAFQYLYTVLKLFDYPLLKLLRYMIIRLIIFETPLIVFRLIIFYKIATYRILIKIENKLLQKLHFLDKLCDSKCFECKNNPQICIIETDKIYKLAKTNQKLNSLLSFPIIVFLIFISTETLQLFFLIYSFGELKIILSKSVLITYTINIFFIIYKCNDIDCSFIRIVRLCAQSRQQTSSQFIPRFWLKESSSRYFIIKLQNLEIYRHYLGIRLFSLCQFNFSMMITLELLLLNLSVIFSQTQNK